MLDVLTESTAAKNFEKNFLDGKKNISNENLFLLHFQKKTSSFLKLWFIETIEKKSIFLLSAKNVAMFRSEWRAAIRDWI